MNTKMLDMKDNKGNIENEYFNEKELMKEKEILLKKCVISLDSA